MEDGEGPYLALVCKQFHAVEARIACRARDEKRICARASVFRTQSRARWARRVMLCGNESYLIFQDTRDGQLGAYAKDHHCIACKRLGLVLSAKMERREEINFLTQHLSEANLTEPSPRLANFSHYTSTPPSLPVFFQLVYADREQLVGRYLLRIVRQKELAFEAHADDDTLRKNAIHDFFYQCLNVALYGLALQTFCRIVKTFRDHEHLQFWEVIDTEYRCTTIGNRNPAWGQMGFTRISRWMQLILLASSRKSAAMLQKLIEFCDAGWRDVWTDMSGIPNRRSVPLLNPRIHRALAMCTLLRHLACAPDDSYLQLATQLRIELLDPELETPPKKALPLHRDFAVEDRSDLSMFRSWEEFARNRPRDLDKLFRVHQLRDQGFTFAWFGKSLQLGSGTLGFSVFAGGNEVIYNLARLEKVAELKTSTVDNAFEVRSNRDKMFSVALFGRGAAQNETLVVGAGSTPQLVRMARNLQAFKFVHAELGYGGDFFLSYKVELEERLLGAYTHRCPITPNQRRFVPMVLGRILEVMDESFKAYFKMKIDSWSWLTQLPFLRHLMTQILVWDVFNFVEENHAALLLHVARYCPRTVYQACCDAMSEISKWPEDLLDEAKEELRSAIWMYLSVPLFNLLVYNDYAQEAVGMLEWRLFSSSGDRLDIFPWRDKGLEDRKGMILILHAYGSYNLWTYVRLQGSSVNNVAEGITKEYMQSFFEAAMFQDNREMIDHITKTFRSSLVLTHEKVLQCSQNALWYAFKNQTMLRLRNGMPLDLKSGFPRDWGQRRANAQKSNKLTPGELKLSGWRPELRRLQVPNVYLGQLLQPVPNE